jgi:hypothetical protein
MLNYNKVGDLAKKHDRDELLDLLVNAKLRNCPEDIAYYNAAIKMYDSVRILAKLG